MELVVSQSTSSPEPCIAGVWWDAPVSAHMTGGVGAPVLELLSPVSPQRQVESVVLQLAGEDRRHHLRLLARAARVRHAALREVPRDNFVVEGDGGKEHVCVWRRKRRDDEIRWTLDHGRIRFSTFTPCPHPLRGWSHTHLSGCCAAVCESGSRGGSVVGSRLAVEGSSGAMAAAMAAEAATGSGVGVRTSGATYVSKSAASPQGQNRTQRGGDHSRTLPLQLTVAQAPSE
jgi:hypothetical protein